MPTRRGRCLPKSLSSDRSGRVDDRGDRLSRCSRQTYLRKSVRYTARTKPQGACYESEIASICGRPLLGDPPARITGPDETSIGKSAHEPFVVLADVVNDADASRKRSANKRKPRLAMCPTNSRTVGGMASARDRKMRPQSALAASDCFPRRAHIQHSRRKAQLLKLPSSSAKIEKALPPNLA
jgi:hypothetical protein